VVVVVVELALLHAEKVSASRRTKLAAMNRHLLCREENAFIRYLLIKRFYLILAYHTHIS